MHTSLISVCLRNFSNVNSCTFDTHLFGANESQDVDARNFWANH